MSVCDWVSWPAKKIMTIGNKVGEEIFAQAGAAAYLAAAKATALKNKNRPQHILDEIRKGWLRSNFASLVDKVRIVYGADLVPSINILGVKLKTSTIAQTFGDKIYMNPKYKPNDGTQLVQLAHEMVHVRQYHNRGKSLHKFGKDYFRGFYRAGFSYRKNNMEEAAYDFDECFETRFLSKIAVPELWRETWSKGWSSFMPFELQGAPHYLAYKTGDGTANIDRIRPDAQGVDTVWATPAGQKWTKGWTAFVPFVLGGKPHYLAYKVGTGQVSIDRIRPDGAGVDTVWPTDPNEKWTKGWTSFVPFVLNFRPQCLAYKAGTGQVHIDRIRPNGDGVDTLWEGQWTKGWTSMIAFVLNGSPHILGYKHGSGYAHVDRVNPDGKGTETIWCDQWTGNWTSFVPFKLQGTPYHLAYKIKAGTAAIDTISA